MKPAAETNETALAQEPLTCNLQPTTLATHQSSNPSIQPSIPARHRRGNIARLPKDLRQRVNEMLDDGLPYNQIIESLGEHGRDISDDAVGSWKGGGYQDYLRELRIVEQCRYRQGLAFDFAAKRSPINGFQATQQIAAAQICEAVAILGPDILRDALVANPLNYFRMLNSFARLTTGGLKCDRHLADQAERAAALEKTKSPRKKGMSARAVKEMNEKLNLM
jgi:hypothetical protein